MLAIQSDILATDYKGHLEHFF